MTRNRFVNILQNLHFNDNETADYSDKANKMRNVINHLNEAFQNAMSDAKRQSIDEHMTKFKVLSKQYMKNKLINGVSSGAADAAVKLDTYMNSIFILAKRKKQNLGLGRQSFWICQKS